MAEGKKGCISRVFGCLGTIVAFAVLGGFLAWKVFFGAPMGAQCGTDLDCNGISSICSDADVCTEPCSDDSCPKAWACTGAVTRIEEDEDGSDEQVTTRICENAGKKKAK